MICKKCGNEIPDESKFCPKCGEAVETEVVEEPEETLIPIIEGEHVAPDSRLTPPADDNIQETDRPIENNESNKQVVSQPQVKYIYYSKDTDLIVPASLRPLSMAAYFGYIVLFCIPLLGLIMAIVFANSNINRNRKNLAKCFILLHILCIIFLIIFLILYFFFPDTLHFFHRIFPQETFL